MVSKIVKLELENIPYATALAKELHGFGTFGQHGPEFDWDFCTSMMIRVSKSPNYYFRLAMVDDEYVGAVVGHVDTFFFSPRLMALEDAWYVRPNTPGRTKLAVALMRGFVSWALDERGAVLVQTGDIAAIDSLAVDSLYRHLGFTRFGTVYKYAREA